MKSVVSMTGVVRDVIVHDRPVGRSSGRFIISEPPQLEAIQHSQMPAIGQAQEPMLDARQGTPNVWDMYRTAQDAQAQPGRTPMPLQGLSQVQQAPKRVKVSLDQLEERECLLQECEHNLKHQELETHELELERRSQALQASNASRGSS